MDKIVFFEVAAWEVEYLKTSFPDAIFDTEKLTLETVVKYKDALAISVFIYSDCNEEVLSKLPKLKLIATRSTGMDHIDSTYCQNNGIVVKNVAEYGSNTVAEHAFALLLALTRKIYPSVEQVKDLRFTHDNLTGTDLSGKTIGIVGLGKIGQNMLKIAHGFGMKVLAYNRSKNPDFEKLPDFAYVELVELLKNSDVISLHLPLTPETKHIINSNNISSLKKGAYLINTARGPLVQTEAILEGLSKEILAGVGLDVLEEEENLDEEITLLNKDSLKGVDLKNLLYDHILIEHPLVLVTPHNAFNSREALRRILDVTIENLK